MGWRRTDAGFHAGVVCPVNEPDTGWIVVEEWLPAGMLELALTMNASHMATAVPVSAGQWISQRSR